MDQVVPGFKQIGVQHSEGPTSFDLTEDSSIRTDDWSQFQATASTHNREWFIRRILVPTDFSATSTKAIQRAAGLANRHDATMTLLHVIDINAQGMPGTAEEMMKGLWNVGSAQMAQLACSLVGQVKAQTVVEEGLPWEVIIEKSCDFDLLVIAKPRETHLWKLFSSHIARRVIVNAACPVMVVPE